MGTAPSKSDIDAFGVVSENSDIAEIAPQNAIPASSKIEYTKEAVTPELAAEYLERAADPQPKRSVIASYAQTMENKGWLINGFPIIFDKNGRLLDGVQRLNAVIASGTSIRTFVARNADIDTLHTIDQQRGRKYTGVLESRGVESAGTVMRTLSKLIKIENGVLGRDKLKISWLRLDIVLTSNPEIIDAVKISESARGCTLHSTARPVLAFMAIMAGKRQELISFLRELGPDHTQPIGNPARMLAIQLKMRRGERQDYSVDQALALAILAFNDFCEDRLKDDYYAWAPDYGDARLDDDGQPVSRETVRQNAPPNLGFPKLKGYTGIREGAFDPEQVTASEFKGELAQYIQDGAGEDSDESRVFNYVITPERAREFLNYNSQNRKIMSTHVKTIARDIREGSWRVNAQPICFTGNPLSPGDEPVRLLNGQHRLHACIEADMPIEVPIGINITEKAFATYDIHAKSKLRFDNVPGVTGLDTRILQAALRMQWRQDNNMPLTGKGSPSASESRLTLERHPHIKDGITLSRNKDMTKAFTSGILLYFIYRAKCENLEYAEEFLDGLQHGDVPRGSPIISLRTYAVGKRDRLSRRDQINLLLEHWEAFKEWKMKREASQESFD